MAETARRWKEHSDDLLAIRRYKDDWDGDGADAPDPQLVDQAINFLAALRKTAFDLPFRVALSPNGAIGIEWQSPGTYVQAEIVAYDRVEWTILLDGQKPQFVIQDLTKVENLAGRARW
jgi:hypothetical protein